MSDKSKSKNSKIKDDSLSPDSPVMPNSDSDFEPQPEPDPEQDLEPDQDLDQSSSDDEPDDPSSEIIQFETLDNKTVSQHRKAYVKWVNEEFYKRLEKLNPEAKERVMKNINGISFVNSWTR